MTVKRERVTLALNSKLSNDEKILLLVELAQEFEEINRTYAWSDLPGNLQFIAEKAGLATGTIVSVLLPDRPPEAGLTSKEAAAFDAIVSSLRACIVMAYHCGQYGMTDLKASPTERIM